MSDLRVFTGSSMQHQGAVQGACHTLNDLLPSSPHPHTHQVISLLHTAFKSAGLGLYLRPYGCLPTGYECGIIECVPNTRSRAALGELSDRWGGLMQESGWCVAVSPSYKHFPNLFTLSKTSDHPKVSPFMIDPPFICASTFLLTHLHLLLFTPSLQTAHPLHPHVFLPALAHRSV